jgi:hypothetical protein
MQHDDRGAVASFQHGGRNAGQLQSAFGDGHRRQQSLASGFAKGAGAAAASDPEGLCSLTCRAWGASFALRAASTRMPTLRASAAQRVEWWRG